MKRMSITRQFMILVAAFAVAMTVSIFGLAGVFRESRASSRIKGAARELRTDALFASAIQMQGTVQRLLREKDPDNIEKLMDLSKSASKTVLAKIRETGAAGGDAASAFEALGSANEKCIGLLLRGEAGQAQEILIEESNPAFERLMSATGKMQQLVGRQEEAAAAASDGYLQTIIFAMAGILIAGLIGFAVLLVRHISRTLHQVLTELRAVSDGNVNAASQISSSSQALAQGASQQAASLEETSASSEEISSITMKNAENAKLAADKMKNAASRIADANTRLEQMVVSMNEINSSSGKISKIIQVIEGIAFQTNILALNAAVEAARAGEAGLGFAVVADEVRNLAQRCAQAAKDTAGLVESSIDKTKEGKNKLDEVAGTFHGITDSAREVHALVDEVHSASNEQAGGVKRISAALVQMQQVTQKNAASAEQGAAAGEELSSQTLTMEATVARLAVMVDGASGAA